MIPFKLLYENAQPPRQATPGAAAYDLFFFSRYDEPALIAPHSTVTLGTGVALALDVGVHSFSTPHGTTVERFPTPNRCGLILPRSGLGCKSGLRPGNSPGLIDPDYRGEILVCLHNDGELSAFVRPGDRIAQLLIVPFLSPGLWLLDDSEELPPTSRGRGGFGSTGA